MDWRGQKEENPRENVYPAVQTCPHNNKKQLFQGSVIKNAIKLPYLASQIAYDHKCQSSHSHSEMIAMDIRIENIQLLS